MKTNNSGGPANCENPELTQSEIDAGVALLRGWLDELDMWFAKEPGNQILNLECPLPVETLNAVVCNLAFSITNRRANVSDPWFRAVDRKWPSLRLVERITNIVTRACKSVEVRPLVRVLELQSEFESQALELCNHCLHMAEDSAWTCHTIDWQDYEKILLRAQNIIRGGQRTSGEFAFRLCSTTNRGTPSLMAYTALLELAHADLVWMVRFRPSFCVLEQFIRGTLSDSIALLEKVAKHRGSEFIVPHHVGFLKEMKTDHLRTGSAKRQQRFREGRGKGNS